MYTAHMSAGLTWCPTSNLLRKERNSALRETSVGFVFWPKQIAEARSYDDNKPVRPQEEAKSYK